LVTYGGDGVLPMLTDQWQAAPDSSGISAFASSIAACPTQVDSMYEVDEFICEIPLG
jgi:hypothetical protein